MTNKENPDQQPKKAEKEDARNGADRNPYSGALAILITFSSFAVCVLAFISLCCLPVNSSPPPIQFFLTTLLALLVFDAIVFQILVSNNQWRVMRKQGRVMEQQLETTERALEQSKTFFEMAERPAIGIGAVTMQQIGADLEVIATVRWKNYGKSPAHVLRALGRLAAWTGDEPFPNDCCPPAEIFRDNEVEVEGLISRPVVAAGSAYSQEFRLDPLTPEELELLKKDDRPIFLWARVEYTGVFGTTYYTQYLGKYLADAGCFGECPNGNEAA